MPRHAAVMQRCSDHEAVSSTIGYWNINYYLNTLVDLPRRSRAVVFLKAVILVLDL